MRLVYQLAHFRGSASPWWDWTLANSLSALQVLLTAAGFGVAIWQLIRSANASVASRALLQSVKSRLTGNDLLVSLPELAVLEDEIEASIKAADSVAVGKALSGYARRASRLGGLLKSDDETKDELLVKLITQAVKSATEAKSELSEGASRDLLAVTRVATSKITAATLEANSLSARIEKRIAE